MLIGAPRTDLQFELADALSVGDARGIFELVNGLVQEGQDLRHVTGQILAHVRDLLLMRSAPDEPDALDAPEDRRERLASQAAKFTIAELSRILSLLLAAQNDMRWTTSPRLTLELALVRASMPETDPNPAALIARLERLERLANLDVTTDAAPTSEPAPEPRAPKEASSPKSSSSISVPE